MRSEEPAGSRVYGIGHLEREESAVYPLPEPIPREQLNTVIHEVMHVVLDLFASDEAKVVAISGVIQPRSREHK